MQASKVLTGKISICEISVSLPKNVVLAIANFIEAYTVIFVAQI